MCICGPLIAGKLEFHLSDLLLLLLLFNGILVIIRSEDQLFGLLLQIGHAHVISCDAALHTIIDIDRTIVYILLLNAVAFSQVELLACSEALFHEDSWRCSRCI